MAVSFWRGFWNWLRGFKCRPYVDYGGRDKKTGQIDIEGGLVCEQEWKDQEEKNDSKA